RFNRGVHTPPSVLEGLANGEAVRHGMAPDPDLPGDGDAQFAEGQFAEDQFTEDEVSSDGGAGDPLSAQDNQAFASLTSDLDQPAEAATPF
ncbi:MAG: hypothetical protein WAL13_17405, partial [Trebonia sp.]